jgi:hypothetical protein
VVPALDDVENLFMKFKIQKKFCLIVLTIKSLSSIMFYKIFGLIPKVINFMRLLALRTRIRTA